MSNLTIRFAARSDIPTLLTFIRELADYEHMSDAVVADSDVMAAWMFERRVAEALLAEEDGACRSAWHSSSTTIPLGWAVQESILKISTSVPPAADAAMARHCLLASPR